MSRRASFASPPPSVSAGRHIVPLLPEFLRRYPAIELDFRLDDQLAHLIDDRIDVAIRNGRLNDRRIIARQLAPMQLVVCGSPAYLRRHGAPGTPEDLARHRCINFRLAATGRAFPWEFERAQARFTLSVKGPLLADDPDTVLSAALAGIGLAQLGTYQCAAHIAAGRLVPVLVDYIAGNRGHYILYASRQHLPQRIRAFVDFVAAAIDRAAMTLPDALNRRGTSPRGGRSRGSARSGSNARSGRTRGAARAG